MKGEIMEKENQGNRNNQTEGVAENSAGRASALLPIGIFLIIFLGAGVVFRDFYAMPAIVAFLIALFAAPQYARPCLILEYFAQTFQTPVLLPQFQQLRLPPLQRPLP